MHITILLLFRHAVYLKMQKKTRETSQQFQHDAMRTCSCFSCCGEKNKICN